MRWLEVLSKNALEIEYRSGALAAVPDALSRFPAAESLPATFESNAEVDRSCSAALAQLRARQRLSQSRVTRALIAFAKAIPA